MTCYHTLFITLGIIVTCVIVTPQHHLVSHPWSQGLTHLSSYHVITEDKDHHTQSAQLLTKKDFFLFFYTSFLKQSNLTLLKSRCQFLMDKIDILKQRFAESRVTLNCRALLASGSNNLYFLIFHLKKKFQCFLCLEIDVLY